MTPDNQAPAPNDGITELPDGSAFAVVSMPLPSDHWLYAPHNNEPPMPYRMGTENPEREVWARMLREAGRYAVRTATMNGRESDFDPDALVQNLIVGFLGYWTKDGKDSQL